MQRKLIFLFPAVAALAADPTTAIKVVQAGYLPDAPKLAMVVAEKAAERFALVFVLAGALR